MVFVRAKHDKKITSFVKRLVIDILIKIIKVKVRYLIRIIDIKFKKNTKDNKSTQ